MIFIFHCFGVFIFEILRNRKRQKPDRDSPEIDILADPDLENCLKFDPPVYKQRYGKVYQTLLEEKWRKNFKKLVDFGCAEFGLFIFLKNLNLEEIVFVDLDEDLLFQNIFRLEPLLIDHLRRRNSPLDVTVLAGSVADPDYRVKKTDVVTAIELIEHLYPDTLDAFPYNIFSFIEPKIAIITTPNADFNVLFNRMEGFRHYDHKFEWTREQFEDWANNITQRFPNYIVDFQGIGDLFGNNLDVGSCSQMALFTRKDMLGEKFISPLFSIQCVCDKQSPCKGLDIMFKAVCKCVCPLCLPEFSVGVCTYMSCSQTGGKSSDDFKSFSDSVVNIEDVKKWEFNPSYNIYYKTIKKIDYPYEIDNRSEDEKILSVLKYRINTFSHENSRFYIDDRSRCEIPVMDIIYGNINVSEEEIR